LVTVEPLLDRVECLEDFLGLPADAVLEMALEKGRIKWTPDLRQGLKIERLTQTG